MAKVTIDGTLYESSDGERLIDLINRTGAELAQVCYHTQLGPIQTCDTCTGRDQWATNTRLWDKRVGWDDCVDKVSKSERSTTASIRSNSHQPRTLLYGLRQQQWQLHCSQYGKVVGDRASSDALSTEAI